MKEMTGTGHTAHRCGTAPVVRSKRPVARAVAVVLLALAAIVGGGCRGGKVERAYQIATGGNARQGEILIESHDCGSCHIIPGVRGARGLVGPPLILFGRRTYIAGQLPNTPENLVRWVGAPHSVEPQTAMPDVGLSEQESRDVAAFLYTLR